MSLIPPLTFAAAATTGFRTNLALRRSVLRTDRDTAMLTHDSQFEHEVLNWLARLPFLADKELAREVHGVDAARVSEMLPAGDGFAKCVGNAAARSAVAIHAVIRTGVAVAAETTGRGGG